MTEEIQGLVHVGPSPRSGPRSRDNPVPNGKFWILHLYYQPQPGTTISRYVDGLDKHNNPTYTEFINEAAKFSRWIDVKKLWRSSTQRPPPDLKMASVRWELQDFGKGPPVKTNGGG